MCILNRVRRLRSFRLADRAGGFVRYRKLQSALARLCANKTRRLANVNRKKRLVTDLKNSSDIIFLPVVNCTYLGILMASYRWGMWRAYKALDRWQRRLSMRTQSHHMLVVAQAHRELALFTKVGEIALKPSARLLSSH